MNILEIVPEENRKEGLDMIRRIKEGKDVKSLKTRRMAKDGRIVEVWLTATKLTDEQGEPGEIATTERDLAWLSG
jgi:two-component system CheB/CheR fusion protein